MEERLWTTIAATIVGGKEQLSTVIDGRRRQDRP